MTSSVGIPLAPESPTRTDPTAQSKGVRQQSPTKWTQTEWAEIEERRKIRANIDHIQQREVPIIQCGDKANKRAKEVISPPVERFIDSVCDLSPIMEEIGQNLRKTGKELE
jgi:hypothetical protein